MKLRLNNIEHTVAPGTTIAGIITDQNPDGFSILMVFRNGKQVRRSEYATLLEENDHIETMKAAAGG
jgi:thiamine biosynthesis protein ThiS